MRTSPIHGPNCGLRPAGAHGEPLQSLLVMLGKMSLSFASAFPEGVAPKAPMSSVPWSVSRFVSWVAKKRPLAAIRATTKGTRW